MTGLSGGAGAGSGRSVPRLLKGHTFTVILKRWRLVYLTLACVFNYVARTSASVEAP